MSDDGKAVVRLEASESAKHIWIVLNWGGKAIVVPSPAILKGGSSFEIVNKTGADAKITFPTGLIDPSTLSIPKGGAKPATAAEDVSVYFEYDVSFAREEPPFYAEGGSKPGIIIER